MKLENIGFYTLSDERARTASEKTPIKRLECIITDRCNFRCPYCRGVKPSLRGEMGVQELEELFDSLGVVENIRFSGGEPTLNYNLLDMVSGSRKRGVRRIAISTNGSAPFAYYKDLVNAGVNDFSISLDACCSAGFSEMSGGDGRWEVVTENIRELSRLTYTTVGIVLNEKNEDSLGDIIRFAVDLGVSDIRVIPSAQRGPKLQRLPFCATNMPILRYRASNHAADIPTRGIEQNEYPRCPLVLDDIAVAGGYHFPCIIYLREGGLPIGKCSDNIREERKRWFEITDTLEDSICRSNCLDVCRDYNAKWGEFHQGESH